MNIRQSMEKRFLINIALIFSLMSSCVLRARSILGELQIIRAMQLAQPDNLDYPHRFASAPFTRHIRMREAGNTRVPFFNGSAFLYKYVYSYGHIGVLTAIGEESDRFNNNGKRFKRSRFGIDDIGASFSFNVIRSGNNYLDVAALVGLATTAADPVVTLVGAGHNQYGANMKFGFDVLESSKLSFAGELQLLGSVKKTVLLNKDMELIHRECCEKPFFKERFDVGTLFSNLFALRRGSSDNGFEVGYHGSILFNVHDDIKVLSYEGFTEASMKSCVDNHKGLEKLTLHKNDHRATFVHHIYAQYNFVWETDWYPIGLVFGGAYAFGSQSWQAFLAWMAISAHF